MLSAIRNRICEGYKQLKTTDRNAVLSQSILNTVGLVTSIEYRTKFSLLDNL